MGAVTPILQGERRGQAGGARADDGDPGAPHLGAPTMKMANAPMSRKRPAGDLIVIEAGVG
jgi:hypothetical protein